MLGEGLENFPKHLNLLFRISTTLYTTLSMLTVNQINVEINVTGNTNLKATQKVY